MQSHPLDGVPTACVLSRYSRDLETWRGAEVVLADLFSRPCAHSYYESPCVAQRPEGVYLFLDHCFLSLDWAGVIVLFSRTLSFGRGCSRWVTVLPDVHAVEVVEDAGTWWIVRVHQGRATLDGRLEIAELVWDGSGEGGQRVGFQTVALALRPAGTPGGRPAVAGRGDRWNRISRARRSAGSVPTSP